MFLGLIVLLTLWETSLSLADSHEGGGHFYFENTKQFMNTRDAKAITTEFVIIRALFFLNFILCISICAYTCYCLVSRPVLAGGNHSNVRASTLTIFYMNTIYTCTVLYMAVLLAVPYVTDDVTRVMLGLRFVAYPLLSLLLCVSNPLLLVVRGRELRGYVRGVLARGVTSTS